MSDLAAVKSMLGWLALIEEPKPEYMPFYLAEIFMQRNKMAISLFSSSVYGKMEQLVMRGTSRLSTKSCVFFMISCVAGSMLAAASVPLS